MCFVEVEWMFWAGIVVSFTFGLSLGLAVLGWERVDNRPIITPRVIPPKPGYKGSIPGYTKNKDKPIN